MKLLKTTGMLPFVFFALALGAADVFLPLHVRLVEERNGNLLFRGPEPKKLFGGFSWDSLLLTMRTEAALKGKKFPSSYSLVDVCLLTHEANDIAMERRFFQDHADKGTFVHYPTYGVNATTLTAACRAAAGVNASAVCANNTSLQPRNYPAALVEKIAKQYPQQLDRLSDPLIERLAFVNGLMDASGTPKIVYFHCECGCDRTGEFAAAYAMRYLNKTFTAAMKYDVTVPERNIGYGNQVAAQWYCEYLYYSGQYASATNDCANCEPFRCVDQ